MRTTGPKARERMKRLSIGCQAMLARQLQMTARATAPAPTDDALNPMERLGRGFMCAAAEDELNRRGIKERLT